MRKSTAREFALASPLNSVAPLGRHEHNYGTARGLCQFWRQKYPESYLVMPCDNLSLYLDHSTSQCRSMDNEEDRDISEENFLDDDHTLLSRIFGLGSH